MEELLVDGIEEILFFCKMTEASTGFFDGLVIGIKSLEEIGLREARGGQGFDDAFDLCGDHVAVGELRIIEEPAHQPLGKQVLDEHLVDIVV